MSGIMQRIFGTQPVTTAPVQQQQAAPQPGNLPANAGQALATTNNTATAANGTIPASTEALNTAGAASSVDPFADLWKTDPTQQQQGQPLFNVSQDKLLATARMQSFKETATPEHMAAIAQGGEAAVGAMLDLMEKVTQQGYAQSVFATTKLIEGAIDKSGFAKAADLESQIRNVQLKNSLHETNPVFSNPAYAPMLEMAQKQFQVKFPNATATELRKLAGDYITGMAEQITAPARQQQQELQQTQQRKASGDTDFSNWA